MEKSLFEQMGGTYTRQGNYLLPSLVLPGEDERQIGIWVQRRLRYLKCTGKLKLYTKNYK